MHDGLSCSLAKGIIEFRAVVLRQVIPSERLAAVLVNTLEDLVVSYQHATRLSVQPTLYPAA